MCELRLDISIEESFDPFDDIFAKPSPVKFLMTQSSIMEIVSPFFLEPSFVVTSEIFERAFALCFCSFSNDVIPVTL